METDKLERYLAICQELKLKPLPFPQDFIERTPGVVDVSTIYFPRKHLHALLRLIGEQSDLHTFILDEADLQSDDIEALVNTLKGSHVASLSLRRVKLHPQSGELLKQLCRTNSRITSMNLEGTMLPPSLLESIALVVDLNRIASETARLEAIPSVRHEAPKQPRRLLEGWSNSEHEVEIYRPSRNAREIVNEAMSSVAQHYIDADFSFGQQLLGRDDIEYYRVLELSEMLNVHLEDCCVGSDPVEASEVYDNRELCAAINVLQQNMFLRNGVMCRSVPEFGLYGFRFFVDDEAIEVVVDDVIPCLVKDGIAVPIGIHNSKTDYWGPLIEKALAKLIGGYSNISSLSFGQGLSILTGGSCLKVDWMEMIAKKSYLLFELVRDLSMRKITVVSCALPETTQGKKALERRGIIPLAPYTLAQTGTFRHKDGFSVHLVQLVGPADSDKCSDTFSHGDFIAGQLLGFPTFWMEFEHFATIFEKSCALIWPRYDPVTAYLQSKTLPGASKHSLYSCEFPLNTAYLLRNMSLSDYEVRVTLRGNGPTGVKNESKESQSVWFLGYRAAGDENKRYAVSEKNKLFSGHAATGKQEVFLFNLKPGEAIQLVVGALQHFAFNMTVTAIDTFEFIALPDIKHSYVLSGSWKSMIRNRRLPHKIFSFTNVSTNVVTDILVAVEQAQSERPAFPISVVGWMNVSARRITTNLEPEFHTEVQNDYMAVWRISKTLKPGEDIVLLPCCLDDWCNPSFRFAVYCEQELQPFQDDCCSP